MVSRSSVVCASKDLVSCEMAGEAVLLNVRSGVYYGLNTVGASVWDCIQSSSTVTAIRDTILSQFEIDADSLERDLLALLQDMEHEGLINVKNENDS